MEPYVVNPILVRMKESDKGIIYQSIVAMGFRARQINDQIRAEIANRMVDVIDDSDTDTINYDQIAISREFDKIPKPTFIAMKEMNQDKLSYSMTAVEEK